MVLSAAAVAVGGFAPLAARSAHAAKASPPSALTVYGRDVWNLEALLRSSFGTRRVYLDHGPSGGRANFTTKVLPNYRSGLYLYTFASANDSAFRLLRPSAPPKPVIGASGGEVPLTVRGSYIRCGVAWLYLHYGNGPPNWQISCHR
jgi:hypothetical protein